MPVKKNKLKRLLSLICLLAIILCCLYNKSSTVYAVGTSQTIIIDAGHGGFDGGASADDGTTEKGINLQISQKLNKILVAYGYKTVLTRDGDYALGSNKSSKTTKQLDLKARTEYMQNYPDSIFVSIHQNKFSDTSVHGFQTFYSNKVDGSKLLAEAIQGSTVKYAQPENTRPVKADSRGVYIMENATIPTVIVECGFLSNPNDLINLKSESYQTLLAFSIANGILDYYINLKEDKNGS